jgi:hypothetical protein
MRVRNRTDHGVFVQEHGVIPGGEEATVVSNDSVKQMIKDGVLSEVRSSGGGSGGGSSDTSKDKDGGS